MNVASKSLLFSIFFVVLIGCTTATTYPSPDPADKPVSQQDKLDQYDTLDELMLYYGQLQKKNAAQLVAEYNSTKKHFNRKNSDAKSRLKYILLISLPKTSFTNIQAALDLLNNWPQDITMSTNVADFRKLLISLLREQQIARADAKNFSQKLKASDEQIQALEEHIQTLQNRIDAIKNMEKHPIRRITP
ncbi:hypothetical protein [Nitrosomonas sp. Nm34]|uniref:hypothetical protein n=1 Tax=Nitrosomonas sp. Nm34 TaxID=1881055 RepID=UPI0008DF570D|nr:hypothetical protein [Nitrosomonas sp. Nm34]SFI21583.1 hypothetical protein SAMN05428978_100290 [Nitrosomonas sp. Nm34]